MPFERTCVTIIDMQNDFLCEEGFYARRGHGMENIQQLFKNLSDTLPSLSKQYKIVYVVSEFTEKQFGEDKSMCLKDTWGAELALGPQYAQAIITKHEQSAFSSKEFLDYLKQNQVSELILMGVLTEWCIRATAIDGVNNGLKVILVCDGVATGEDEESNRIKTFDELKQMGVVLKNMSDILC